MHKEEDDYTYCITREPIIKYLHASPENQLANLRTIEFNTADNKRLSDYIMNSLTWNLCSQKLKNIIDKYNNDGQAVEWYEVSIFHMDHKYGYYIPIVKDFLDALDIDKSTFSNVNSKILIKPVFKYSVLNSKEIFTHKEFSRRIYVSKKLHDHIRKEHCTGVAFGKVEAL
jgi:hypothetical protein